MRTVNVLRAVQNSVYNLSERYPTYDLARFKKEIFAL